jgi:uncharacterized membrane protein YedE/YeeE
VGNKLEPITFGFACWPAGTCKIAIEKRTTERTYLIIARVVVGIIFKIIAYGIADFLNFVSAS